MKDKLRRLFLRDGLRKLIALLLAVLLYFGIHSRITAERIISGVPVNVTLASELIGSVDNITTNVTVKGSESTISALTPEDLTLHVVVDQNNLVSGHTYVVETIIILKSKFDIFKFCQITNNLAIVFHC